MMRRIAGLGVVVATIVLGSTSGLGCEFVFSHDRILASLGTVGEIGVRVQKTHTRCTLSSMDEYQFAWENVQILGSTAWENVDRDLYEKWFRVSLSEIGEGYLMISKTCSKNGYEEAILPIDVLGPDDEDGVWSQAMVGTYPLDEPVRATIESVAGFGAYMDRILTVGDISFELPNSGASSFEGDLGEIRLFFTVAADEEMLPLLIVSERLFVRYDHLMEVES